MALSVEFNVHAVNIVPVSVSVEHDGEAVRAIVDCCEVELTSVKHGSLTLRFTGKDCGEARQRFAAGQTLTWAI